MPLFSICIPTHNNAATLGACLRTVLDQSGDDYEILVSDDQGPPEIKSLAEQAAAPERVRYLRSPRRLGLRGNFEHCVAQSRGQYVTVLGADDGFCRNALDTARTLLAASQPDVFFWFPHIYWWPDALLPHKRWMLYVRANPKTARLVNPREYVDRFYDEPQNLWLFERLPSIYNGFVRRDLLERIRQRTGSYFHEEVADVGSGIATGIMATSAALVERPLSIRGLSAASSGVAFRSKEAGRATSENFVQGMSSPLCAAELGDSSALAVHLASVRLRATRQFAELANKPIRVADVVHGILRELNEDPTRYDELVADAQQLVNRYGLDGSTFVVPPRFTGHHSKLVGVEVLNDGGVFIAFDGEPLGIGDIGRAALFIDSLLR